MKATLGGVPLDGSLPVTWRLVPGGRPFQTVVQLAPAAAEALLGRAASSLELVIEDGDRRLAVPDVYVLGEAPAGAPYERALVLSDRRWKWERRWVVRAYNVRRRTGDRRRLAGSVATAPVVDDVYYAPWSLRSGKPWTAEQVLEDVLGAVDLERRYRVESLGTGRSAAVEDLELDDPGPEALERALALLPGLGLVLDMDGTAIVYPTDDDGERGVLDEAGPAVVGTGVAALADASFARPASVEVLFDREVEMRFDYLTAGGTTPRDEGRALENVAPCPDVTLEIPASAPSGKARTVVQGTWVALDDLLKAWEGSQPTGVPKLTDALVAELFNGPMLYLLYAQLRGGPNLSTADYLWARRIAAVVQHYRQTFRLAKRWRDRIRSLRAYRVGILDPETGARAPALVLADHAIVPSLRALVAADPRQADLAVNVAGWSASTDVDDAHATPALVTVLDEDQGILRVDYRVDPFGQAAAVLPSQLATIPSASPLAAALTLERCPLATTHRLAVVVTCVQGAPNDARRLHKHLVTAKRAEEVLGRTVGDAQGPRWQLRVAGGLLTARFAWSDDDAAALEQAFGVGTDDSGEVTREIVEVQLGKPANEAEVKAVAEAVAAAFYAQLRPHLEGERTVGLNAGLRPRGRVGSVTHVATTAGVALTTIDLPGTTVPLDLMALLPDSVRRTVQRLAQP